MPLVVRISDFQDLSRFVIALPSAVAAPIAAREWRFSKPSFRNPLLSSADTRWTSETGLGMPLATLGLGDGQRCCVGSTRLVNVDIGTSCITGMCVTGVQCLGSNERGSRPGQQWQVEQANKKAGDGAGAGQQGGEAARRASWEERIRSGRKGREQENELSIQIRAAACAAAAIVNSRP